MVNNFNPNYTIVEQTKVEEINSEAYSLEHNGTGAKILILKNDDDNKTFSITFRTTPENSTGVAHILEHSVLCGSEKYPVKEPFVEMAKGSLNTFLNAMTYPDKTMYPIASRNNKDFKNLMSVYLDAVFFPNIYKDETILMQEGWHYELENPEDELKYKGVVYNEMKGVYSSPDSMVYRKIYRGLLPDTTYGVDSGGNPKDIPNLTQEEFINFHKKYYHPSNAYIVLYGDIDINERLEFLHNEYLSKFSKEKIDSKIKLQKPFKEIKEIQEYYSISKEDDDKNKSFFTYNFAVSSTSDVTKNLAYEVLEYVLIDAQGAPLKKALLEKGLCEDVYGSFDKGIAQPVFSIIAKNVDENKKDEIKNVIMEVLKKVIDEGVDKKFLEAALNKKEFYLREGDFDRYPKGVIYSMVVNDSWIYDGDPLRYLVYEDDLKELREKINTNYYEELVKEAFIDNKFATLMMVSPKKGLEEEETKALHDKLQKIKASMDKDTIDTIVKNTELLKKKQETPDSPETLKVIPTLELSDIDKEAERLPLTVGKYNNNTYLYSNIFTNKILYPTFLFNTKSVAEEDISYIPILARLLTRVNTKNYTYEELAKEIDFYTGGIDCGSSAFFYNDTDTDFFPYMSVKGKTTEANTKKLLELMDEVILNSSFEDKNRVKEIIFELKSRIESSLNSRSHVIAATRALSYVNKNHRYLERNSGYSFYIFLCKLSEDIENDFDGFKNKMEQLRNEIFNKDNLYILLTCGEEEEKTFRNEIDIFYNSLGDKKFEPKDYKLELEADNEGFTTSGTVQYVAKAGKIDNYNGSAAVLKSILSLDYLWNKVRVMGGAYGCFASIGRSGNLFFTSYRDPNLNNTIDVYNNAYEYIKNFDATKDEMKKYIIGTIAEIDAPLTPAAMGEKAQANYLKRLTYEEVQKEREEILSTTVEDIRAHSEDIKKVMEDNNLCVIGNEKKIKENCDEFHSIEPLVK